MTDPKPFEEDGKNKDELADEVGKRDKPAGETDMSDFVGGEPEGSEEDKDNV